MPKKAYVGMSGGVDSSVSAALLKRAGFDVTGVFIKVWQPDWVECNWKEERIEAMRAAAALDIPFVTLDLEKEYKKEVIDYMIAEYRSGRTPNPDVMCNRYVKFGAFWRWAKEQGADFVATGHYARNILDRGSYRLLAGVDKEKDQSYFLWTLREEDLQHIIFPVGHLEKKEVRSLAKKYGLPNADKKDSQGLCFIGKVDVKDFLSRYIDTKEGKVLDPSGKEIGTHPGSELFTIGERHGFTLMDEHKSPHDKPYYVISKDVEANTITVADEARPRPILRLNRASWVGHAPVPSSGFELFGRARYRQPLQKLRIVSVAKDEAEIEFEQEQKAITPGQSLVIYDGEVCLGGGIIA